MRKKGIKVEAVDRLFDAIMSLRNKEESTVPSIPETEAMILFLKG